MTRSTIAFGALLMLLTLTSTPPSVAAATVADAPLPASRIDAATYRSTVFGVDRHILIYLPEGYDARPSDRFPVLYLRHGGGQSEADWLAKGDARAVLDHAIAAHAATPMIVVFTAGTIPPALGSPYDAAGLDAAGHELIDEVIPLIEAKYRTRTGSADRAIAGLSMGAGQSFAIGQAYSERFSAIGVFSAGTFGIVRPVEPAAPAAPPRQPPVNLRPFDPARDAPALADPAGFNRRTPLLYIAVGDADPRVMPTAAAVATMRAGGLRIVTATEQGGHDWPVWRAALADFVPRLFRPAPPAATN